MIQEATHNDIPALVSMGRDFHAMSGVATPYIEADVSQFVAGLIANPQCAVFRSDNGVIGGVLVPAFCAHNWLSAVELFWWAKDGLGRGLLKAFEEWAAGRSAEVRISTLAANPRVGNILERLGYAKAEQSYVKVF